MSQQSLELLPIRFDPQTFADHDTELHGLVATKAMARLLSSVASAEPMVITKLRFSPGLYGYPHAMGDVHCRVKIRCERCLDEVEIDLDAQLSVLIKPASDRLPEDGENQENSPDFHEYDGKSLALSDLIEEELLLELPLVPKHEDISLCNQDMVAWLASNEAPKEISERADNPFAILKR